MGRPGYRPILGIHRGSACGGKCSRSLCVFFRRRSKKAAAQGGETFTNPCDKWFCTKTRGYGNGTKVFAAGFGHAGHPDVYEMEWEPDNKGVPGIDRTKQYTSKPLSVEIAV